VVERAGAVGEQNPRLRHSTRGDRTRLGQRGGESAELIAGSCDLTAGRHDSERGGACALASLAHDATERAGDRSAIRQICESSRAQGESRSGLGWRAGGQREIEPAGAPVRREPISHPQPIGYDQAVGSARGAVLG